MSASELKDQGNAAFAAKKFSRAAELYGKAIAVDPSSPTAHVLYSNRCAALLELGGKAELALADADKCVELNPAFLKGHLRRAMCLQSLGRFKEAVEACGNALALEPSNADVAKLQQQCAKAASAASLDELCKPIPLPEMLREAQQVLNVRDTLAMAFPELAASEGAATAAAAVPSAATASIHNLSALAARYPAVRLVFTPGRGRSLVAAADLPAGTEVFTEPALAWYSQFGDVLGAAIPRLLEVSPAFAAAGGNVYAVLLQLEPFASAYGLGAAAAAAAAASASAAASVAAPAAGNAAAAAAATPAAPLPADAVADILARIAAAPSRSKADIAIRAARANTLSGCFADAINDETSRLLLFAPVTAMLNSDCDPSCRYTVSWSAEAGGPVLRLSTLRDVPAGGELSIIYTDPAQPTAERKGELRRYDFECTCARCSAPHEDTVVFTCPAPGCANGRVFGNASACADCGAALADPSVAALPSLEHRDGGAWFAARTRYLTAVETGAAAVGRNGVPRVTAVDVALGDAASGRSAADVAKGGPAASGAAGAAAGAEAAFAAGGEVWGSATAGAGTASLPPAPLHITDAGRLHALYATLGAAWALDPRLVARVYATALPAFEGHRMWTPLLPQLHLLAGHVNAAAGDVAAAKAQYAAAAARYAVLYGPAKAHPYTALVAGLADAPPRSRHDVERVEHRRLMEGTWETQGLPKPRAAKWRAPVEAAPGEGKGSAAAGGSGAAAGGAGVAAAELLKLDHGRVADQLKRLTAQVLGTRVDGTPRVTAGRDGSGGAPAAATAVSSPASSA